MKGGGLRNEEEGIGLENVLRCKVFGVRPFLPSFLGWDGMGYSSASFYKPPPPFPPFFFLSQPNSNSTALTKQALPSIHPFFLSLSRSRKTYPSLYPLYLYPTRFPTSRHARTPTYLNLFVT